MSTTLERFKTVAVTVFSKMFHHNVIGQITDEEILAAEVHLNVRFPKSYKWFLRTFGYSDWPEYIAGLGYEESPTYNVVRLTEDIRAEDLSALSDSLLPFSPDGWGGYYLLDTSVFHEDECPVVLWDGSASGATRKRTHNSFLDWLEETVLEMLVIDAEIEAETGEPTTDLNA